MKKKFYISSFTFLGMMIGFFLHAVIEVNFIPLLMNDFQKYGLGLSWYTWESIHNYGVIGLIILGAYFGFSQGKKWWNVLYVQGKYNKYFRKPLKTDF